MEGTSSLEVGDLSSVVSVTIKEGGKAHTFEVQKRRTAKRDKPICYIWTS